MRKEESMEW